MSSQHNRSFRAEIDGLATRALIASSDADSVARLLAGLSEISRQAAEEGFAAIPPAVAKLQQEMGKQGNLNPLLSGIGQLQKLLDDSAGATAEPAPSTGCSIAADPELLGEFFVEARDHLISIEAQLLIIEREPSQIDALHTVFRSFHTIKGLAGFLELDAIRNVAHEVEALLDLARNEKLVITPPVIDVILEGADYLKTDIARVERELKGVAASSSLDYRNLLGRIQTQMAGAEPALLPDRPNHAAAAMTPEAARPPAEPDQTKPQSGATPPADPATLSFTQTLPQTLTQPEPGPDEAAAEPPKAFAAGNHTATSNTNTASSNIASSNIANAEGRVVKVDIGKLDFLMDIVGELVIAQSMVTHDRSVDAAANPKLLRNLAQLTRITGEVQKTAMGMRMVPVGQLFKRSVRLVRDLMRKSGKDAELVLTGEETEVDRNIVEELADPLMHMIRNASDHAIEPPEERIKAGKNPKGKIQLKAYHQAGSILIDVADDGRGLDREKILKKARERGLITDGSQLPDKDVFNLIFEPGFSTAEKVTDISGRGVGMDVVHKQIQRMRGRVDIESKLGQGTTFHLKLPLTLAIIDGLVVGVGGERYIAPIYAVREMFRPAAESIFTVEGQAEMVLVRGGLLPVVRLYQRFGVTPKSEDITQSLLVVVESEARCFCLVVDELIDTQEVVIKNLGETFRQVGGIAGGTILGDGRVGLILDIDGLFTGKADA